MILRFERQRLLDDVAAEKARILPDLKRMRGQRQALADFVDTGEALFATLDAHLESRIALTVDRIGRYSPDLDSDRLNELSEGIKALLFRFGSVAERQSLIPRELYEIASWFFSRCTGVVPAPRYVLSTSDSFETDELHQFVDGLLSRPPNRHLFPELKKTFRASFFFIFLPHFNREF